MEYKKEINALFGLVKGQGSLKFGKEDYEAVKDAYNFTANLVEKAKSKPQTITTITSIKSFLLSCFYGSFVLLVLSVIVLGLDIYPEVGDPIPGDFIRGVIPILVIYCTGFLTVICAVLVVIMNVVFSD